jgi:hypothetical protein
VTPALLALLLAAAAPIAVRHPPGTLHGFPSLSDASGKVIADGELTQEVAGRRIVAEIRWRFRDGRSVDERDEFRVESGLRQERFRWVERRGGEELRRFEVDFATGAASSAVRDREGRLEAEVAHVDEPRERAFAGYGAALAASQLSLPPGGHDEITFVAFTPKPRAVRLEIRREVGEDHVDVQGRSVACDRFTLHPVLPFPVRLFVHPPDAHLWFTHAAPPALVRARQNLVAKDDPIVVVDVTPRGPARARAPAAERSR